WHQHAVSVILSNPVYKGTGVHGRQERLHDELRKTGRGLKLGFYMNFTNPERWTMIPAPALVDAETWEVCQERMHSNRATMSGNPRRKYLLTGFVRCPVCRRSMCGKVHKTSTYYFCERH